METPLALETREDDEGVSVAILQGGQILASSGVVPLAAAGTPAPMPWLGGAGGLALPLSDHCLACGADNPVGLQVGLTFDDEGVWARVTPRAPWRADGGVHPGLAPVILDEIAWWLGALVMKEGGLTNRITLTLLAPALPLGRAPLVAAGRFAAVTPVDRKRTFWRTLATLATTDGELVATASIVFRGGPDYSIRQMPYLRARTAPDVFRRMFPAV